MHAKCWSYTQIFEKITKKLRGVRLAYLGLQLKYCSYTSLTASYYSDLHYYTWEIKKSVNHAFSN